MTNKKYVPPYDDNLVTKLKNLVAKKLPPSWYFNFASFLSEKRARSVTYGKTDLRQYKEAGKWATNLLSPYYDKNSTVLDIGCGIGRVAKYVAPRVRKIWCVDISRIMLKRARKFVGSLPNVEFYRTNGHSLNKIPSNTVDFAYSFDMFPHLSDDETYLYLKEMMRILSPGGKIFFQFADLNQPHNREVFKNEAKLWLNLSVRIRFITAKQLETLAEIAGFKVEKIVPEKDHEGNIILIAEKEK